MPFLNDRETQQPRDSLAGAPPGQPFDAGRFWRKFRALSRKLPFAEDLLTAYFTAVDPRTPNRVRVALLAALAYFVMPADLIPDIAIGLGFTDDAAVLAAALKTLAVHILPRHRAQARLVLNEAAGPAEG
jgi:uncharacterized membrane protein YkvA (DUF1232 family)